MDHSETNNTASTGGSSHTPFSGVLGTGLVEITALTTLIGSNTAEQLALGNRGPTGLAWMAMSTFGSLSVLRACIAASTPGWLRDTLGVRSATTDSARGLSLDLASPWMGREDMTRRDLGDAIGVTCGRRESSSTSTGSSESLTTTISQRDVYAFDQLTQKALDCIPPFRTGDGASPKCYIFIRDNATPTSRHEWTGLLLTLGKLVEVYVLCYLGAVPLAGASGVGWIYFFISAITLLSLRMSVSWKTVGQSQLDIIGGSLPTARQPAGDCRILLGSPIDFRQHRLWTFVWAIGAVTYTISLACCYFFLSSSPPKAVYSWVGFQTFWLLLRSLFFHRTGGGRAAVYPTYVGMEWYKLRHGLKSRVLDLILALSKYQMHVHPRGSYSYREDVADLDGIRSLLADSSLATEYPLADSITSSTSRTTDVAFHSVMGDTLLHSSTWFLGSKLTAMDMYDCCIVFLPFPSNKSQPANEKVGQKWLAVPAARALGSIRPSVLVDIHQIESGHGNVSRGTSVIDYDDDRIRFSSPKGSPNAGMHDVEWIYWIPCTGGRWIQTGTSKMKILGSRKVEIQDAEEMTRRLQVGNWNISLENSEMIGDIVNMSREAAKSIFKLFQMAASPST